MKYGLLRFALSLTWMSAKREMQRLIAAPGPHGKNITLEREIRL